MQDMQEAKAQREVTPREVLLAEATKIVTGDRNKAYGNPEDNFQNIAHLWNAYWKDGRIRVGETFTSMDVVVLMMLVKIARLKTNPGHRDSLVDVAGYAACGADIQAKILQITPQGNIIPQNTPLMDYARNLQR